MTRTLGTLLCLLLPTLALAHAGHDHDEDAVHMEPHVERSAFTTDIADREPVDQITSLGNDQTRVYFFTELMNLEGTTVVHRWEWNGTLMAEVPIAVGAKRWRAYSSKNLDPLWLGDWKVTVVTESGDVLAEELFTYHAPEE